MSPTREDLRNKLRAILRMTEFGDWMMLYMIAKNVDRVTFTECMDAINYPDYRYDLEPLDPENVELLKREESDKQERE